MTFAQLFTLISYIILWLVTQYIFTYVCELLIYNPAPSEIFKTPLKDLHSLSKITSLIASLIVIIVLTVL